jgi:His/Glu/Gln/Arg/opine family amino acid ABC transporter permease subunit
MGFDYHVLVQYRLPLFLGLLNTIYYAALCLVFSVAFGLVVCVGALSESRIGRFAAQRYVNVFRVIPELALIFWMYFCLPPLLDLRLSPGFCGVLALSLTSGAYMAEVFRAGVLAVPRGLVEAAMALGVHPYRRWRHIILPLAVRAMMPAFVNTFADLLKHTTLLAGIGVAEVTYEAYTLGAQSFRYLEFFTIIAAAYFVIIFPLSLYVRHAGHRLRLRTAQ